MRESLRAWQEQFETFALEVIFGQRRGKKAALLRGVLFGLSKVFLIIVKGRRWLYEVRIIRDHPLGVQVITCLLYTSPSPRDATLSRMPSSA